MSMMASINLTSLVNGSNNSNAQNYLDFCTEHLGLREEKGAETVLKLTAYTVAFVLAVIANSLVIAIVLRRSTFKTTTNLFIINMALSDVMMAFVCMPTTMYSIASKNIGQSIIKGAAGTAVCKLLPFLQGLAVAVSVLSRFALAADRYLAILYPFKKYITKNKAKVLIVLVWIVGTLFNAPLLYAMTLYQHGNAYYCIEIWEPFFDQNKAPKDYTIVLFVFLYAVPLILITFLYTALIKELWSSKNAHSNQSLAFKENKAVFKMLVTVIVIFAVCWLPIHVTVFVVLFTNDDATKQCGVSPVITFIGWFMGHVNSSINPIIYFCYNERFRTELIKILQNIKDFCSRKNRQASSKGSLVNPSIIITQFTVNSLEIDDQELNDNTADGIDNKVFDTVSETCTSKL